MFIKVTKNRAGQAYYHLVESYRDSGKVCQRTLLSLGRVENGGLENLSAAIAKHSDRLDAINLAKEVDVAQTYILGPLLVLERLFERTGVQQSLKQSVLASHPKLEFDFLNAVFTLVAARFVRPCSKLAVFEELVQKLDPNLVHGEHALHHFYRTVDLLAEHKEDLEKSLYWFGRDLFTAQVDVVLYDLTTLRFESVREDLGTLRRFGFSKEMRTDCTQVVLGLLIDQEGTPLGFEVYPGNTFEGHTLNDIVEKMRHKFNVRRFIFVADRGLFSKDNIDKLKQAGGEFLVGMRIGPLKNRTDLYDMNNFRWLNEDLAVFETTHNGDRCLVTWTRARAIRDRKVRDDILRKIRKKLSTAKKVSAKTFVSNSNYQKFIIGLDKGAPLLNEEAVLAAQKKDGFFAILTNVNDLSPAELFRQYKQLWKIEDAFGEIKGTLKSRPIFHWTDQRIVGHLMLCFIAYFCEAHLTHALRGSGVKSPSTVKTRRPLSAATALRQLADVRSVPISVRNETIWVRTDINGAAADLFAALGLRIPPKVLRLTNQSVVAQGVHASASC